MRNLLIIILLALTFVGCKPTPPKEPGHTGIRHKTGKIVSVYEVMSGFEATDSSHSYANEALILKNFQQERRDTMGLFDPLIDSQGNIYSRDQRGDADSYFAQKEYKIYKNFLPLEQYNRYPEILKANYTHFQMFLVYDQLYVIAKYDSQFSFCVDGDWYPIETDEGPVDSVASKVYVDNDTIYFLKRISNNSMYNGYDIVKIPVVNGRPQKGIMAHYELYIQDIEQQWPDTKALIIQNGHVLIHTGVLYHPNPTWWYNRNNWAFYIDGVKICDNTNTEYFGGMGVVGNDVYYCTQDFSNDIATIYKNEEVYQTIQNVWLVMRTISCGDDMYMIIFREDENGTKYKDVWHNGQIENHPYTYLGAIPNHKSYYYYTVPQISYETYTQK